MKFHDKQALATVRFSLGVFLAAESFAQDPGWRERAERESQRAAASIRWQYESRRSAAHARMRLEQPDSSLYGLTLSASETQLSCPALLVTDTRSLFAPFIWTW